MRPQAAVGSAALDTTDTSLNSPPQQVTVGQYFWSFAAKFVCGYQNPGAAGQVGEPPVKPGNYATEINIHNYNYRDMKIWKKLVVLVGTRQTATGPVPFAFREPQVAQPSQILSIGLGPDTATMDDCNAIWAMADQTGMTLLPGALTIGYLVIVSPIDLDVDVVYTAEVPGTIAAGGQPTGIAIDVERVTGQRVYVPAGVID